MRMHLPDNRVRDFEIPFEALASTTDLLRAFAKYELIQSNHKDAGSHMHAYPTLHLVAAAPAAMAHSSSPSATGEVQGRSRWSGSPATSGCRGSACSSM